MKIGCDIVSISRIEKSLSRKGFREKVFHESEIKYCESRTKSAESYAARFAAKEAFTKALGTGIMSEGISISDIWIEKEISELKANTAPRLCFSENVKEKMNLAGFKSAEVTLSHEGDLAIAFVLLF